jgi:hypothetical protein
LKNFASFAEGLLLPVNARIAGFLERISAAICRQTVRGRSALRAGAVGQVGQVGQVRQVGQASTENRDKP